MSGLFKKVIWVWPSWDEDTHEADDITETFAGGLTVVDINKQRHFCECQFQNDGKTKTECLFVNRSKYNEDANYDGSPIDPKNCDIKKSIKYQQIVDHSALHKLIHGELVAERDSLLLDIDEDFFGCVLRGHRLVDAGIAWSVVEEIDELTNEIFCPELTEKETVTNHFMRVVLSLIIKHCKSSKMAALACVTPGNPTSKTFSSAINSVVQSYSEKGIFCTMYKNVRQKRLEMLLEYFIQMTIPQIRACGDLGFCMQTSPRSFQENGFQLCHGANEPNTTIVTQHSPGENELLLRLKRVRRMLQQGRYPTPGMVTLCRSVRDGYTATEYFEDIEEYVLKSITKSKRDVKFNVIYDINLLGGKTGWPSREIKSKKKKTS